MSILSWQTLSDVADRCIGCGLCVNVQGDCGQKNPINFGNLASAFLQSKDFAKEHECDFAVSDISSEIYDFTRICLTCSRCTSRCPVGIRASKTIIAARSVLNAASPEILKEYRRYRCDMADSHYVRMRKLTGAEYEDMFLEEQDSPVPGAKPVGARRGAKFSPASDPLSDAKLADEAGTKLVYEAGTNRAATDQTNISGAIADETSCGSTDLSFIGETAAKASIAGHILLFLGCTLANNFPKLGKKVYEELLCDNIVDSITVMCCGKPLALMGAQDDFDNYTDILAQRLVTHNIDQVIAACPNCYYTLRQILEKRELTQKITLKFLSEVLVEKGYRFTPSKKYPYQNVSIHDSCPDRYDQVIADSVREIFSEVDIVELDHSRRESICCGSGGFSAIYGSELSERAFSESLDEFFTTRSRCLITSCATCASTYKSSGAVNCHHYLELLFDEEMDLDTLNYALDQLWEIQDGQSEPLINKFDDDTPFLFASTNIKEC